MMGLGVSYEVIWGWDSKSTTTYALQDVWKVKKCVYDDVHNNTYYP